MKKQLKNVHKKLLPSASAAAVESDDDEEDEEDEEDEVLAFFGLGAFLSFFAALVASVFFCEAGAP